MTPLQKIAMGLVVVLVDASFAGYDGVADPLGWSLVLWGLLGLRPHQFGTNGLLWLAGLALVVSVVTYPPQVAERIVSSVGWALSLPQLVFSFVLCVVLAPVAGDLGRRFRLLRWLFVVLAVVPVIALGADVEVLLDPLAFAVVATYVYLVYLLFRASSTVPGVEAGRAPS